ncbi:MAG: surface-adhesin E family protein [Burkholderiales bacterium]
MKPERIADVALACMLAASSPFAHAQNAARQLVAIKAPQHDPLYLDAASLDRNAAAVTFKYLLDVPAPPEEGAKPPATSSQWRSNEIEATIDCRKHTVQVRRLVTYSGPRGTGTATAVHSFIGPGLKAEPITPKSTFAYLEQQVCRGG